MELVVMAPYIGMVGGLLFVGWLFYSSHQTTMKQREEKQQQAKIEELKLMKEINEKKEVQENESRYVKSND